MELFNYQSTNNHKKIVNVDDVIKWLGIQKHKLKETLKTIAETYKIRLSDYQSGGDRFGDIVTNIRGYINIAILFALILTSFILFISF